MERLKFTQLLMISKQNRLSNLFQFSPNKNLITAENNGCGKSTLLKSLLWSFGCEPRVDSVWESQNVSCLIDFTIGDTQHQIYRDGNHIYYFSENYMGMPTAFHFDKITGKYAEFFASLVGFDLLLLSQNDVLEVPPPAFYFLPYYIDQEKDWNDIWKGLDKLGQYARWQRDFVQYHIGYTSKEYFELKQKILDLKNLEEQSKSKIKQLTDAENTVKQIIPSHSFVIDEEQLSNLENELTQDLDSLLRNEEEWVRNLSLSQANKHFLDKQLDVINKAIQDFEKDYIYIYATEYLENKINCPTCGTIHDNSLVNRASFLEQKNTLMREKIYLEEEILKQSNEIYQIKEQLVTVRQAIQSIHRKYNVDNVNGNNTLDYYILGLTPSMISNHFNIIKNKENLLIVEYCYAYKELEKQQKRSIKDRANKVNDYFSKILYEIKINLKINSLNTEKIKTPLDYTKLGKSGGGSADKTRVFLTYRLALYHLIAFADSEVLAPLLIDTPNQHEQDEENYQSIIEYLSEDNQYTNNMQLFLCAMSNPILEKYKENACVIELDSNKILNDESFDEHSKIVEKFLNVFV